MRQMFTSGYREQGSHDLRRQSVCSNRPAKRKVLTGDVMQLAPVHPELSLEAIRIFPKSTRSDRPRSALSFISARPQRVLTWGSQTHECTRNSCMTSCGRSPTKRLTHHLYPNLDSVLVGIFHPGRLSAKVIACHNHAHSSQRGHTHRASKHLLTESTLVNNRGHRGKHASPRYNHDQKKKKTSKKAKC